MAPPTAGAVTTGASWAMEFTSPASHSVPGTRVAFLLVARSTAGGITETDNWETERRPITQTQLPWPEAEPGTPSLWAGTSAALSALAAAPLAGAGTTRD